jgi:hypothetical protein
MKMTASTRIVGGVTVVDLSGRIVLGNETLEAESCRAAQFTRPEFARQTDGQAANLVWIDSVRG